MVPEQGLVRKKEAHTEMKDWIYRLSKGDLITELDIFGIDADKNLDDLRWLSRYVDQHSDEFRAAVPTVNIEQPVALVLPPDPDLRPVKMMKYGNGSCISTVKTHGHF